MPADKQTAEPRTETMAAFGPAAITAGLEAWKAQPVALAAYFGDVLKGAETQMRRQADFLGQLSRCKDLPEAIGVQAGFVQEFWTESLRQMQTSLLAVRKASLPTAES